MFQIAKRSLVIAIITALLIVPFASTGLAEEYFEKEDASGGEMMYDFIIVRPIGIEAGEALVKEPAAYTFKRPLGQF